MKHSPEPFRILFLCTGNSCRSQIAEGFARARAKNDPTIYIMSAGTKITPVHPLAKKVMGETGVDLSQAQSKLLTSLGPTEWDLVIALCDQAAGECPITPGNPVRVNWNLWDPAEAQGDPEAVLDVFRRTRDEIRRLVDDLFDRGYMQALVHAKRHADLILNNMSEGIIAHDMQRNIFYFNRAAEEITGYRREDVLGRDCHQVFPTGFCGSKCSFCNEGNVVLPDVTKKTLEIGTPTGDLRRVEMTIKVINDGNDRPIGILASFRDYTRELELARRLGEIEQFSGIIGRDAKMQEVYELIRDVADSNVSILVQGESGTGKELVAAAIHREGARAGKLFVPVNCGALPESLLESELFGHVRGAFTGAIRDKKGRFELADNGTIFLDEIGDISQAMQVKLLRVLQEGTFERVGSEKTLHVDVRVISATNKDLHREVQAGRFRDDLFYRLSVLPIQLPPLRERRTDIPLLAEHILKRALNENSRRHGNQGRRRVVFSSEALDEMLSYHWPGNVRELQNWIQFALVKCKSEVIEAQHLPPHERAPDADRQASVARFELSRTDKGAKRRKRKLTREAVDRALAKTAGNKLAAARELGVGRATLYRFLDDQQR